MMDICKWNGKIRALKQCQLYKLRDDHNIQCAGCCLGMAIEMSLKVI